MPSAGLPIENLLEKYGDEESRKIVGIIIADAECAMTHGLFMEWLELFVGAWNKTHDVLQASHAGIIEWDM